MMFAQAHSTRTKEIKISSKQRTSGFCKSQKPEFSELVHTELGNEKS